MWMVFNAYLLLRRFGGAGSEVLAAAVGFFGMALVVGSGLYALHRELSLSREAI